MSTAFSLHAGFTPWALQLWRMVYEQAARKLALLGGTLLLALAPVDLLLAQNQVALGQTIYTTGNAFGAGISACSSCHFSTNPPVAPANTTQHPEGTGSNHPEAANFAQLIRNAFAAVGGGNGVMTSYLGSAALDPNDATVRDRAFKLALYIGQFKAPAFKVPFPTVDNLLRMTVRSGVTGTKDVYGRIQDDGSAGAAQDTGGLVISNTTANASAVSTAQVAGTATVAYNLSYRSVTGFAGADTFRLTVINPSAAAGVFQSIPVTVLGINNSVLTAQGFKGQTYTAGVGALFRVTSNDAGANTFTATTLPTGLSINSSTGDITGTPSVTGDFVVTVGATTTGAINSTNGTVSKDITLSIAGVTNLPSVSYNQNQAIPTYQVTTFPAAIAASYSINNAANLPAGLTFNAANGTITGTPTPSGSFSVLLGANTAAGAVTQNLAITVVSAGAPVITTTPALPAAPTAAGTVGQLFPSTQINATNPPLDANSYSVAGLPAGLAVSVSTGQITGTPTASGDFNLVLRATNSGGVGVGTQNITIRINPNTAPMVSAANLAPSNINAVFPAYQVVASNLPILSYAVVAPSTLPPGLSLNTSTGQITGTPTSSGVFTTLLTATNAFATSSPAQLGFTITPTSVPVISSPTFVSLGAGVPLTPIQVVASNPVLTLYGASGLPPGISIDTTSGVISGTPTAPGTFSATLTASNAAGSGSRVVPFTIGIPAPLACAMSVPLNTATTLDLATCLFAGFAPTGVSIVATPAHGSAVASGTRVTFTPTNNYFGPDSFTFVGTGAAGNSARGVVTVTVTGRPDPTQDAVVTAVLAAQAETAQRFSRAQISNFQRRMESLHRGAGDTAQQPSLQGAKPAGQTSGFAAAATTLPREPFATASALAGSVGARGPLPPADTGAALLAGRPPVEIGAAAALDVAATGLGLKSLPFAESVFSLVKSRSVNLAGVASGVGLNAPGSNTGGMSYWVEGVASFGTRDAAGGLNGSEFSSNGISIGADRRLSDALAIGMGLGYARDSTTIGTDGSKNRSRGYSLAVYGSYLPSPNTFVDAMLGFGSLDFDSKRFVAPINDFAYGQREGKQVFGSLTAGYEFRDQALLVSPYGRLDFSHDRLGTSSETGAAAFALTYFSQSSTSVQGALGLRAETVQSTDFGYAVPRLRAEYRHEFQGSGRAFIGYADQPGGPRFALSPTRSGRNSIVLGIGSDFLMRDGLTLSMEYQLSHSFSNESGHALRLRLTKEFDSRGMPKLLGTYTTRRGKPMDVQVDAAYTTDDNVTRAKSGPDKLGDDFYSINASKTIVEPLSEQSRVLLTGSVGGEKFRRYNGLSRITASAEAEYQYRDSSDFNDPTLAAFGKFTAEGFETGLRDGYRLSAGVSVRQPLSDRINLFAALSHNRRYANSSVFDTRENALRTNIDYALSDKSTLYLSAEYRRGDIVSTGRASLENVTIAKVFAQDDAYAGGQMFSYRFDGSTVLTTLGYNLALGPRDSLDFSWRFVRSTPGLRPSFVTSPRSYKANQLSAVYLMRF